ncbi:Phosphatidylethanolamine-binding protein PEBP [Corchorus capsularis]|uniref:Phosphatidylethanolamine-binding protein PEBP n=1 Tax=Corchorus capsularis TaxID=210143 RepID=A0A1R3I233_COCAP|nr:Phosphatidylethanolamine-binding protein PEBP [Corchorus capsularis]
MDEATKGRELVPFMGPCPPTGTHRYILARLSRRERRRPEGFNCRSGLGLPVGEVYFNSQKEPALKKR